ncbi:hypothetical protein EIK56_24945 [Sphingomonas sp. C8-2]|nr:hypothetical protein EIK56_24945 [Sphingomonas sp. C8-2]
MMGCKCHRCVSEYTIANPLPKSKMWLRGLIDPRLHRMFLCEICGNKRCPHATDHRFACTNSNEPGQAGSRYAHPPTPSPVTDETLTDEVQRLIAIAYAAGCQAVHDNYQEDRDPDFSEAASDYARSIDLAALASTPQPAAAETVERAVAAERERCAKILDDRAAYFDRTTGHFDREDAARSYRASAADVRRGAKGGE